MIALLNNVGLRDESGISRREKANRIRLASPWLVALLAAVVALTGCENGAGESVSDHEPENLVTTSNYPLYFMATQMVEEPTVVRFDAPDDIDPSFWQPDSDAIEQFQKSKVILMNGATYEKWAATTTLPESRITKTSNDFKSDWITIENAITHRHGPGEEHSHAGTATHTWLDPRLALLQAESVRTALTKAYPDAKESIDARYASLEADLIAIDERVESIQSQLGDQALLASHPVYQYLGRRLGDRMESVDWEPGVTPSDDELSEFDELHNEHGGTLMLWEGEPSPETRTWLDAKGIKIVVFPTCGNRPVEEHLIASLNASLDRLEAAMSSTPSED